MLQQGFQLLLLKAPAQVMVFCNGTLQRLLADGLQQIVDAVHLESLQGIFIIGSGKNDRAGDRDAVKDGKRRPVSQMNVHENEIRHGMLTDPIDTVLNRLKHANNFGIWADFSKKLLERLRSHQFVFNN